MLLSERSVPQTPSAAIRFEHFVVSGAGLEASFDFAPALLIGRLSGRLGGSTRNHLRQTFRSVLGQRPERLVVDASDLETCDVAGLSGLVDAVAVAGDDLPVAVSGLNPVYSGMLSLVTSGTQERIRQFGSVETAVAELLAGPAAPGPDRDTLLDEVRNLHRALLTRGTIDQAKGVLMAVYGLDAEAAFAMLVWYSRRANLPLHELSRTFLQAVRQTRARPLTTINTDELLSELTCRPPDTGRRHDQRLPTNGSAVR
jgi:anti-anti-sigma regulatory factor